MKTRPPAADPAAGQETKPQQRAVFSKEFKLEAVARLQDGRQSATALAAELGVQRTQLYKWAKALEQAGKEASFGARGRKPGEQASEPAKLRRQQAALMQDVEIRKEVQRVLDADNAVKYATIAEHAARYPVQALCDVLGVARASYYASRKRAPSRRSIEDLALRQHIRQLDEEHGRTLGIVKTWTLLNERNIACGKHRVSRLRRTWPG